MPFPKVYCQMIDCKNNKQMECEANDIEINGDGYCIDFQAKEPFIDDPDKERS